MPKTLTDDSPPRATFHRAEGLRWLLARLFGYTGHRIARVACYLMGGHVRTRERQDYCDNCAVRVAGHRLGWYVRPEKDEVRR